ncbi:hypothetical protein CONLIGDRAFT_553966, partial [Coniochaeta ligniaria NRRL 30616]
FIFRCSPFLCLLPPTCASILLLYSDAQQWYASPGIYNWITSNRASAQLIVQIVASILGFFNVFVFCTVLNYLTRLRLSGSSMSLNTMKFWNAMLSRQLIIRLPVHLFVPLVTAIAVSLVPPALWAGALTPVVIVTNLPASIQVPSYTNTTLLTDGWSNRTGLPSTSAREGLFTFNVGERFIGPLLQAAFTATTVDGSPRMHTKLDYTGFNYIGRSYGVGTSAGLLDSSILTNRLATYYTYQEPGYRAEVTCIYNSSSMYLLTNPTGSADTVSIWVAEGYLPNSGGRQEFARYPSYSTGNIVAIGVATGTDSPGRMFGIAAGENYTNLNNTQCSTDFVPDLFNVTVNLTGRNITVRPAGVGAGARAVPDMEPSGNLTFLANWQFTLISTDQTSLYTSLVGNSFNASIQNYAVAAQSATGPAPSDEEATLRGLENSVTAMLDGILNGYAGAQMMVALETESVPAWVGVSALRFGQRRYIIAIAAVNFLTILWVVVEGVRARGWADLQGFDYMD